ncbi:PAS domain S-box protein [Cellulophaga baltica]|uniref:PAS domain S-box protein n=1 Tax=Cellulophaga baltica TaxID=76594 RepID=UPI00249402BC|nr:PAS domain S-box protein [Cellulophaga baltica]
MKLENIFRFFKSPITFGLTVFAITLALTQFLNYQSYLLFETKKQKRLVTQANWVEQEFKKTLDQGYSTTQTLAFIVAHYGVPKNFDSISNLLIATNKEISALEIVNKQGVITHVFPEKENSIIGFNILKDSLGKKGANETIKRKDYFVTGPIRLKQGGIGFVGRTPIFKDDKFEGFTSAIISLKNVLESAKLHKRDNQFLYRLTKVNPDKSEQVYFSTYDNITTNSFSSTVEMPHGEWKLYVSTKGRLPIKGILLFGVIGLFVSILAGSMAWYLFKQPKHLDKLVRKKNLELVESEEKYRNLVEQASDGILLGDKHGNLIEVNIKACELFGYTKSELLKLNISALVTKEHAKKIPERIHKIFQENSLISQRILVRKDGTEFYGEISATVLPNKLVQGIVRDVSSRIALEQVASKNAEQIKESEEKYRMLVEEASDGIFLLNKELTITDVNHQFCRMFRSTKDVCVGSSLIALILPEDLEAQPLRIKELTEGKTIQALRKMLRKDGTTFTAQANVKMMPNHHFLCIIQDVTEREETAEILRNSALKYRELTERISDGFVALDKGWKFNYVNAKACDAIGKSYSELIGTVAWDTLPYFTQTDAYKMLLEAMKTQQYRYIKQYREEFDRWYEYRMYPSAEGISVYFKDITKIKKTEEQVLKTKAKMESAIRIGKIGYWSWDMQDNSLEWSNEMYTIFDLHPDTPLTFENASLCIHPEDRKKHEELINHRIQNKDNTPFSYRVVHKDNSIHHVLVELEILVDENDEIHKFHGTVIDMTDTIRVKEELKESQEKFYKSFHSNLVGKVIVDADRIILEANDTVANLLETTRENLIGKSLLGAEVLNFELHQDSETRQVLWDKLMQEGILRDEEITYYLKNGKKIPALLSIEPLKLNNRTNYLVSAIDNTKRKEAEHLLEQQNEELSKTNLELDRFVYSASHELRAPLSSVMGLIDIILHEDHDEALVFKLDMMQQSVKRLDDFIKDIVQYSQNKHLEIAMEPIDFRHLINESLESLWYLKNRKYINMEIDIKEIPLFYSDKKRISIIFNNLISNAIKYHNINAKNPRITITIASVNDEVSIQIADNGIGIPEKHLDKIFEMFYRVSSKVMGTGIGLYVIKEIVTKLNGTITVVSEPNVGTKFVILLPNQTKKSRANEVQTNLVSR